MSEPVYKIGDKVRVKGCKYQHVYTVDYVGVNGNIFFKRLLKNGFHSGGCQQPTELVPV